MRATTWAAVLCAAAVLWAAPTRADEAAKPAVDELTAKIAELEAAVAQHKKDKDEGALEKDLQQVATLHRKAAGEAKHEDRLTALLGTILQAAKGEDLERAVLVTIGGLGDDDNWKHVRKFLAQPDVKVAPPLLIPAIEAAGKLKVTAAIEPLMKIVEDSKEYTAAAAAIRALGSYGENKKVRAKVLEALVDEMKKAAPGGRSGKGGAGKSATDTTRWDTLSPAFVEAANQLTGRKVEKAYEWFELYDRHKNNPETLFPK